MKIIKMFFFNAETFDNSNRGNCCQILVKLAMFDLIWKGFNVGYINYITSL